MGQQLGNTTTWAGKGLGIKTTSIILQDLHERDKNVLGELERRISKVRKELERCRRQMISQDYVSWEKLLRYKLVCLQEKLGPIGSSDFIPCGLQRGTEIHIFSTLLL